MPVGKAFLHAFMMMLLNIIWIYKWIIILRAIISWVSPDPYNPIVRVLTALTEPVLRPLRRIISPYRTGGLDFTPVIVFLVLYFFEIFIRSLLFQLGWS